MIIPSIFQTLWDATRRNFLRRLFGGHRFESPKGKRKNGQNFQSRFLSWVSHNFWFLVLQFQIRAEFTKLPSTMTNSLARWINADKWIKNPFYFFRNFRQNGVPNTNAITTDDNSQMNDSNESRNLVSHIPIFENFCRNEVNCCARSSKGTAIIWVSLVLTQLF